MRVSKKFLEQGAFGEELDLGPSWDLVVETDRISDQAIGVPLSQGRSSLTGYSVGQGRRRNSSGLRYGNGPANADLVLRPLQLDLLALAPGFLVEELRYLSTLSGTRLANENEDMTVA